MAWVLVTVLNVGEQERKQRAYPIEVAVTAPRIVCKITSTVATQRNWTKAGWLEVLEASELGKLQSREYVVQFQAQILDLPYKPVSFTFRPVRWIKDFLLEIYKEV